MGVRGGGRPDLPSGVGEAVAPGAHCFLDVERRPHPCPSPSNALAPHPTGRLVSPWERPRSSHRKRPPSRIDRLGPVSVLGPRKSPAKRLLFRLWRLLSPSREA